MVVIFKYLEDTIDTMGCGCGDACELNTDGLFTVKKTKKKEEDKLKDTI
jgi:hypothetical protein